PGSKFKLDEAVHTADAVVEAVVENISCIENKTGIYAIATLRLTKTFKGNENDSVLQATYPGGFCNGDYAIVSHGISLHKGQDGLFFLHSDSSGSKSDTLPTDYHLSLVITYHHGASVLDHHIASYRGVAWDDLERDLLRPIEAITKKPRHILAPAPFETDTLHPIPLNGK
ncbi:MAG: hypothetical protein JST76_05840, partial [Bacteroidetes bacterium]|nr:hypothetical protein [Bacteroidota bacterium]